MLHTICRSPVCYARSTISRPVSCLLEGGRKRPNVLYLSRLIGQIETLRKSKLHYVFQHDKQVISAADT